MHQRCASGAAAFCHPALAHWTRLRSPGLMTLSPAPSGCSHHQLMQSLRRSGQSRAAPGRSLPNQVRPLPPGVCLSSAAWDTAMEGKTAAMAPGRRRPAAGAVAALALLHIWSLLCVRTQSLAPIRHHPPPSIPLPVGLSGPREKGGRVGGYTKYKGHFCFRVAVDVTAWAR